MLLKIVAFIAAAIPLIVLARTLFFRKPTRLGAQLKEFKRQVDIGIWIMLGAIGCIAAFAIGKLVWAWWTAL